MVAIKSAISRDAPPEHLGRCLLGTHLVTQVPTKEDDVCYLSAYRASWDGICILDRPMIGKSVTDQPICNLMKRTPTKRAWTNLSLLDKLIM